MVTSVTVKDASGTTQTVNTLPALGAAATAAALPVTVATDQTIPVSLASVPSHAVTNAGTFAVQVTSAPTTTVTGSVSISGANTNGQATMANSSPVVLASDQSTIPATQKPTATANGTTSSRINAAASTNATSLKATAGQLYAIDVFNVAAYDVFLKLYNKASAPTVGTDTPVWTIPIKAGTGYSTRFLLGKTFSTGLAYAITKLQADSDTTAVAAGDVTGSTDWI